MVEWFLLQQEHRFTHNLHVLLLWSLSRTEDRVWTLLLSDMHIAALHRIFDPLLFFCDIIALFFVFVFFTHQRLKPAPCSPPRLTAGRL